MANWFKTMFLLTALAGLFLLIGGAVGGKTGAAIALAVALVFNFGSYWLSDKIVLKSYKAQEVTEGESPRIYAMSARIPLQAGQATSHLFIVKPFTGRGFMNFFSTHPPIEKRIARLMEKRG